MQDLEPNEAQKAPTRKRPLFWNMAFALWIALGVAVAVFMLLSPPVRQSRGGTPPQTGSKQNP
jgi:hypothetical protein